MELWKSAKVQQCARDSASHCLFGYGSLLWKAPEGAKVLRTFPARIHGFRRRFWMRSSDHRGTVENPGRVVTLIQDDDPTASVFGLVFEIGNWDEIIEDLDYRERHGYTRTITRLEHSANDLGPNCSNENGPSFPSDQGGDTHVYYYDMEGGGEAESSDMKSDSSGAALVFGEATEQTAKIIASAVGPSGPNVEYFMNLCDAMENITGESLEKADPYLAELRGKVRAFGAAAEGVL